MRWFLTSDGDCRDYIVPMEEKERWDDWKQLNDEYPEVWPVPEYAIKVEGGILSFENPEINGEKITVSN